MARNRKLSGHGFEAGPCDLRSPGWLAGRPTVGVILFLIGAGLFGWIAFNVAATGPLLQWDEPLNRQFHAQAADAPARLIEILLFGFFAGKELLLVITMILSLYFLHKRFWLELLMLLIGAGGGAVLWSVLIGVFDRARPAQQVGIVVTDPSFPSGHAISAVICYGLLAYLFIPRMPSLFWKWVVGISAVLTMVFIGYSRLFLGGHYLTDILAGYALGLAWAGLVFTLLESFFLRKKLAAPKNKLGALRNGSRQ